MIIRKDIIDWLQEWERLIRAVDMAGGRRLFSEAVVSFGTYVDSVRNLDSLVQTQWAQIWPATRDFRFELESLCTGGGRDRDVAFASVLWSSMGISPTGDYPRRGRATIVLERQADGVLVAVHTHFSMSRGYIAKLEPTGANLGDEGGED